MSGSQIPLNRKLKDNFVNGSKTSEHLNCHQTRSHVGSYPREIQLFPLELRPVADDQQKKKFDFYNEIRMRKLEEQRRREVEIMERSTSEKRYRIPRRTRTCDEETCPALNRSSCYQGTDVYRHILGPTPDESILAGLQTVIDICGMSDVCRVDSDTTDSRRLSSSNSSRNSMYCSQDFSVRQISSDSSQDDYSSPSQSIDRSEFLWCPSACVGKPTCRWEPHDPCAETYRDVYQLPRNYNPPCPFIRLPPCRGPHVGEASQSNNIHCRLPDCPVPVYKQKDKQKERKGTVQADSHARSQLMDKSVFSPGTKGPMTTSKQVKSRKMYGLAIKEDVPVIVTAHDTQTQPISTDHKATATSKSTTHKSQNEIDEKYKRNSKEIMTSPNNQSKIDTGNETFNENNTQDFILEYHEDPLNITEIKRKDSDGFTVSNFQPNFQKVESLNLKYNNKHNKSIYAKQSYGQISESNTASTHEIPKIDAYNVKYEKYLEPISAQNSYGNASISYVASRSVVQEPIIESYNVHYEKFPNNERDSRETICKPCAETPKSKIFSLKYDKYPKSVSSKYSHNSLSTSYIASTREIEELKSPIEELKSPIEELKSPIEELKPPIEELKSPIEELKSPIEESKSPIEESTSNNDGVPRFRNTEKIDALHLKYNKYAKAISTKYSHGNINRSFTPLSYQTEDSQSQIQTDTDKNVIKNLYSLNLKYSKYSKSISTKYSHGNTSYIPSSHETIDSKSVIRKDSDESVSNFRHSENFHLLNLKYSKYSKPLITKQSHSISSASYTPLSHEDTRTVLLSEENSTTPEQQTPPSHQAESYEKVPKDSVITTRKFLSQARSSSVTFLKQPQSLEGQSYAFPGYSQVNRVDIDQRINMESSTHSLPDSVQQTYDNTENNQSILPELQTPLYDSSNHKVEENPSIQSAPNSQLPSHHSIDKAKSEDPIFLRGKRMHTKRALPVKIKHHTLKRQPHGEHEIPENDDHKWLLKVPISVNQSYIAPDIWESADADNTEKNCEDCRKSCCLDKCCGPSRENIRRSRRANKLSTERSCEACLEDSQLLTSQCFPPLQLPSSKSIILQCFNSNCACPPRHCNCPAYRSPRTRFIHYRYSMDKDKGSQKSVVVQDPKKFQTGSSVFERKFVCNRDYEYNPNEKVKDFRSHTTSIPPVVQPVIGVCTDGRCGGPAANERLLNVRYSIVRISTFSDYTTYEILKSSAKKPRKMPCIVEGIFVTKR